MNDRISIPVELGERSYAIQVGRGVLAEAPNYVPGGVASRSVFILADQSIIDSHARILADALDRAGPRLISTLALPGGERTKSLDGYAQALDWLLNNKVDRRSILFAVGGGVFGDLGGFCAATVLRGIPFVQVPTTLLAQVDSSVGGKTGINRPQGKNLVGSFYQPDAVLCDLDTLRTLPRREILAGYAEIVKYGLLGDAEFFIWLEKKGEDICALESDALARAIVTSCRKKAEIVREDEREQGRRALLNLGHTFGHALEAACGYDGRLVHGEAVAIGIALAFQLSARRGHCSEATVSRVLKHFRAVGLPVSIGDITPRVQVSADDLILLMHGDKKAQGGRLTFILVNDIGAAFVTQEADMADVRAVLNQSMQMMRVPT